MSFFFCCLGTRLIPINVNMQTKKNMEEHSTIYYDIQGLILRRGQEFSFITTFNQGFHSDKYQLSIVFKSLTWPNLPVVKIPLNGSSNGWSARSIPMKDQKNNQICFEIISSSDTPIGKYDVNIKQKNFHFYIFLLNRFYLKFVQLIMV